MKILVIGGDGMLGHQLVRQWSPRHDVRATVRRKLSEYSTLRLFSEQNTFDQVDVRSLDRVAACIAEMTPEVIVNAAGLVKQRPTGEDCIANLEINALFPHYLALLTRRAGARLIHFSTDCVYSGRRGSYTEMDIPDAEDDYGRSKLLGELHYPDCLTLRTSIIGRELTHKTGLLEWFLAQRGPINGFTGAIYSGLTTLEIARVAEFLMLGFPEATGVWNVSSDAISKCDLLQLVRKHFNLKTEILPDDSFSCDRSLASERFRSTFSYSPPSWDNMIEELALDADFYR
jgi:dTDP-4-dehydrorhamnose reductase